MTNKKALAIAKGHILPTKPALLEYIHENPHAGKREIAKAFGVKGTARHQLADILNDIRNDHKSGGKKLKKNKKNQYKLPPVTVLDIVSRNSDGILLARPHVERDSTVNAKHDKNSKITEKPPLVAVSPNSKMPSVGIGVRVLAKIFPTKGEDKQEAPYKGRIIRVLTKQKPAFLALVEKSVDGGFYLEPIDRKQPELLLNQDETTNAQLGDLVLVEPKGNGRNSAARMGVIKKVVGEKAGEKALSAIALYDHEIPVEFPQEVLDEAQNTKNHKLTALHEDWRNFPFITIDPKSAKDHDDAVFACPDPNPNNPSGYIIMVAIADVAAYVVPNSAMDQEARKRGNSVYFPDRVVPMLPEEISNDLCSLRENEDRPAIAVKIWIDRKGRKINHAFHRVIIRSHAKLSYEQAQEAINKNQEPHPNIDLLDKVLKPLWRAYASLKLARDKRQPLELNLPERKIFLDENGRVKDVRIIPRLDAHKLIEEFMIAANISAAETLKAKDTPLLFRVHDSPSLAKQEGLKEFLKTIGIKLGTGAAVSSERFNQILEKSTGKDYEELVNQVILRAQSQAEYSSQNIGHFGLKLRDYAHFTSPIRRYADLLIHRGLISACNLGQDGLTEDEITDLDAIASEISVAERRAMQAERETKDRLIAHYLSENIGAHFQGRINGVTRAGLFITLDQTGADGLIPISSLKDEHGYKKFYHFDEANFALIGERSSKGYRLGDIVEVELTEVQKAAGSMRFEMLSEPRKLPFSTKSFHKSRSNRKPFRTNHRRR